jgi:sterol desaturase/sphingolipid hydroxylase (fatty acid hydroxylase superfamily)
MEHHYKTPQARFGVSTSMWDEVFRTEPHPEAAK